MIPNHCVICGATSMVMPYCSARCESLSVDVIAKARREERERVLLKLEDYANAWFAEPTRAQFMAELRRLREEP